MERMVIDGMIPLRGDIHLHGAKNSALPLLAATVLMKSTTVLENCPPLSDVAASTAILRHLGCEVCADDKTVSVTTTGLCRHTIPEKLMREMRSSIVFLGAILAATGEARLCFPGGCELGPRPIDLHLSALRQMGVKIRENGGVLHCAAPNGLHGAVITLSFPSVGATENVLLAAVLAKGDTVICNAAKEPEIVDLCRFLNNSGAQIEGGGESVITVHGVESLNGCRYRVMPDRIEAATYMSAVAVTGGEAMLYGAEPSHLLAVDSVLEEAGCRIVTQKDRIYLKAPAQLRAVRMIRTMPYPGFPTDAQAPVMAMLTRAKGTSVVVENIFDSRFKHVGELQRMGARIKTDGRVAVIEGVDRLSGASVCCTDLRGGAALVVAGLAAAGRTTISRLCHLDRGYTALEKTLTSLGARVVRTTDGEVPTMI